MEEHRRLLNELPSYAEARARIETLAWEHAIGARRAARTGITRIPVVVHVVWNTAAQNISDAQIRSQIDVLNRDFRRTNPDLAQVPAVWANITADSRIEFVLATRDPNGQPTAGITRTQTQTASFSIQNDPIKSVATGGADPWPANQYLNIWVGPDIRANSGDQLLGYATFPGGPANIDGVVIWHSAFGTMGTAAAPFDGGRTATHEIGHWLNLFHIWGDDATGCGGSDEVADTPNQGGFNIGCPTFPSISCNNDPNGDMFMNYMDYTDDGCMFMFTSGQVIRMQATLDGPRVTIGANGAWDHWHQLGIEQISSDPDAVSWGPNRIDVFVRGTDNTLYTKSWDGTRWDHWHQLGVEEISSGPAVCSWAPDRLDVFARGTDNTLYTKSWDGTRWDHWHQLGIEQISSDPAAVSWGPNRIDVFARGTDNTLYTKSWDGTRWDHWHQLGVEEISSGPAVCSWAPDRLDVFARGTDNTLYTKSWDGTRWDHWHQLGIEQISSDPAAVSWGPNRIDVFARGTDNTLYTKSWDGTRWDHWHQLGVEEISSGPAVCSWAPDRLDVFARGTDNTLYTKSWVVS